MIKMLDANLVLPFQLLDFAIKNDVELFVNTDSALERLTSIYSLTKKQFLDWLKFRSKEIKVVNMQIEHFYGPGAGNTNFISLMIENLLKNEPKIDLTQGEQKRDFLYFEDVVDAYEQVINLYDKFEQNYSHFEIGSGKNISIKELMILLKELTKSKTILNFGAIPYRENEMMESECNLKSIYELGWKNKHTLKQGIEKTIESIL
jgi:nucleoside-diphosphate-sugar epimerase